MFGKKAFSRGLIFQVIERIPNRFNLGSGNGKIKGDLISICLIMLQNG